MKLSKILLLTLALSSLEICAMEEEAPDVRASLKEKFNCALSLVPTGALEDALTRLEAVKELYDTHHIFIFSRARDKKSFQKIDFLLETVDVLGTITRDLTNRDAAKTAFEAVYDFGRQDKMKRMLYEMDGEEPIYLGRKILKDLIRDLPKDHPNYETIKTLRFFEVYEEHLAEYTEAKEKRDIATLQSIARDVKHVDAYFAADSLRSEEGHKTEALAYMQALASSDNKNADLAKEALDEEKQEISSANPEDIFVV